MSAYPRFPQWDRRQTRGRTGLISVDGTRLYKVVIVNIGRDPFAEIYIRPFPMPKVQTNAPNTCFVLKAREELDLGPAKNAYPHSEVYLKAVGRAVQDICARVPEILMEELL